MTDKREPKSNRAGPSMTREQLDGADPALAAAFIDFAERLGKKARAMTEAEDGATGAGKAAAEMKEDGDAFLKKTKARGN